MCVKDVDREWECIRNTLKTTVEGLVWSCPCLYNLMDCFHCASRTSIVQLHNCKWREPKQRRTQCEVPLDVIAWAAAVEKRVVLCEQGTSGPPVTSGGHSHEVKNNPELHAQHFIRLLNCSLRPKSQSPSMSSLGIRDGLTIRWVGTWLLGQWDVKILPGKGELGVRGIYLVTSTGPLEAMECPGHSVPEEKICTWFLPWCQKDLVWWVERAAGVSGRCMSVRGSVTVPPPYWGKNSPRGWGLTYTVEFSLQEDGAGKIQPKFKAGIALKRVMHSWNPIRCRGKSCNSASSQVFQFKGGSLSHILGFPCKGSWQSCFFENKEWPI